MVQQEQFELDLLIQYLPEPLTDNEIAQLIEQVLTAVDAHKIGDMGKVMAELKPLMQGRADMGKVSAMIKSKLS